MCIYNQMKYYVSFKIGSMFCWRSPSVNDATKIPVYLARVYGTTWILFSLSVVVYVREVVNLS